MTGPNSPATAALAVERAYAAEGLVLPKWLDERWYSQHEILTENGFTPTGSGTVIEPPRRKFSRVSRLVAWAIGKLTRRQPDFVIGGGDPYLMRWWVIPRNRLFNVYLHLFLRDDDDRAHHDHPWINCSVLLQGRYIEHKIRAGGVHVARLREPGAFVCRLPSAAHRITLIKRRPCWSLFITGPVVREWGFHCPRGWVHWRAFTNPADGGATVGRGCD